MGSRTNRFVAFWSEFRATVIWQMLRRQAPWVLGIVALNVVNGLGLRFVLAQTQRSLIDRAIIEQTAPMGPLLERFLILVAIEALFGFAVAMASDKVSWSIEYDLRNWLYERLQRMAPQRLDTLPTGQLITRATSDIFLLERLILFLPQMLRSLPLLVFNSVLVMTVNVPLGLLSFAALPISIWVGNRIRKRVWGYTFASTNESAKVTSTFDESVRGIRVVKALGQEDQERSKLQTRAERLYDLATSRVRFVAKWDFVGKLAPSAVRAAMLILGFVMVVQGDLTLGTLSVVLRYAAPNLLVSGIGDDLITFWQVAKTGMGRIQQLITWEDPEPRRDGVALPERVEEGLAVQRLTVQRDGVVVLDGFDLEVRPGELVVVAGDRGAGKSTLAYALTGDLVASKGRVLLEGLDTAALDLQQLRRVVRIVGEEPHLFGRSVRYNLEFGADALSFRKRSKVADAQLLDAIRAAAAEDVVAELPDGLGTVLSDRGLNLSGGQRQRLALARALVEPPRVLILDDALSAVNPGTEMEILRRVRAHCPATAIVVLSRRDGPDRVADRVVRLDAPAALAIVDNAASGSRLAEEASRWMAARDGVDAAPSDAGGAGGSASRQAIGSGDAVYDRRLIPILAGLDMRGLTPARDVSAAEASRDEPITMGSTLRPFRKLLTIAAVVLVGFTFLGQLPEYLAGKAQDAANEGDLRVAISLVLALLGLQVLGGGFGYLFRLLSARIDQGVMYLLRQRLFHRLTRLGVDYYDREPPGQVATRVVYDLDRISNFTDEAVTRIAQIAGTYLFTLAFMLLISVQVTLYVLLFVPLIAVLTIAMSPFINRALVWSREATGDVTARLQEDFAGRYVVKSYGAEQKVLLEYFDASYEVKRARRQTAVLRNIFQELVQLSSALAIIMVYDRAGNLVITGALTYGSLFALERYLDGVIRPIPQLGNLWQRYLAARVSFKKLRHPFDAPVLPAVADVPEPVGTLGGHVELRDVDFAYPGTDRLVLSGVDLAIEPGAVVALVGPTGAGKSSIAKLIGRLYDPTHGAVLVDGHDLRALDLGTYRHRVGVVPQDAFVFRGSVKDNIAYGRPDASFDDVAAAVRAVGAWDALVPLLGGFVEEEGRNLTAAQRQLVALARARLVDPDILILDEATSALDPTTEDAVMAALTGLGRTTIIVTHRQSVAEAASFVVVVEKGRITEAGAPEDLVHDGARYRALWGEMAATTPTRPRRGAPAAGRR